MATLSTRGDERVVMERVDKRTDGPSITNVFPDSSLLYIAQSVLYVLAYLKRHNQAQVEKYRTK
jgi:hypothetical protein